MLVLDAGAPVALDRNDRAMWASFKDCKNSGSPPLTHGGVVGQVWRAGPRQARLAAALSGIETPAGRRPRQGSNLRPSA